MTLHLFAGNDYYPYGGWHDYVGEFGQDLGRAKAAVDDTRSETIHEAHVETFSRHMTFTTSAHGDRVHAVGDRMNRGEITEITADEIIVSVPRRVKVSYCYEWAHIVNDETGKIIAEWWTEDGWTE